MRVHQDTSLNILLEAAILEKVECAAERSPAAGRTWTRRGSVLLEDKRVGVQEDGIEAAATRRYRTSVYLPANSWRGSWDDYDAARSCTRGSRPV